MAGIKELQKTLHLFLTPFLKCYPGYQHSRKSEGGFIIMGQTLDGI